MAATLVMVRIAAVVERTLRPEERDLNLDRFVATQLASFAPVEAAVAALPFLGSARVVVVKGAHELRAEPRRALLAVAERVPEGNTLLIEDRVSPSSKRPEPLAKSLGRAALRIDTSPTADARERFVRETLAALGVKAEPAALAALLGGEADLAGLRTDLEKLALSGTTIGLDDVLRETLVTSDVRAYRYAAAAVAGRAAEALALAHELFSTDPRGAAVPLLAALAAEYGLVWEAARARRPIAERRETGMARGRCTGHGSARRSETADGVYVSAGRGRAGAVGHGRPEDDGEDPAGAVKKQ